jgi:hypothetical protein
MEPRAKKGPLRSAGRDVIKCCSLPRAYPADGTHHACTEEKTESGSLILA